MIVRHHQSVWRYRGFEHCSSGYESSHHTWVNHGNHPIPIPIPKPIYLHAPESQICDFSPAPWNQWLVSGGVCQMNRGVGFVRTGTCRALNPLMMRHSNEGVSENCCTCTCPNKWHFHAGNSLISLEKNGTWWSSWVDLGVAMGSRVADFFFPWHVGQLKWKLRQSDAAHQMGIWPEVEGTWVNVGGLVLWFTFLPWMLVYWFSQKQFRTFIYLIHLSMFAVPIGLIWISHES